MRIDMPPSRAEINSANEEAMRKYHLQEMRKQTTKERDKAAKEAGVAY